MHFLVPYSGTWLSDFVMMESLKSGWRQFQNSPPPFSQCDILYSILSLLLFLWWKLVWIFLVHELSKTHRADIASARFEHFCIMGHAMYVRYSFRAKTFRFHIENWPIYVSIFGSNYLCIHIYIHTYIHTYIQYNTIQYNTIQYNTYTYITYIHNIHT